MKISYERAGMAAAVVLSLGLAGPVFAQSDSGTSASQSMNAAGESMKSAASDTASAAKDAYHGTATAVRDTEITGKVKVALHDDTATEHSDIQVSTSAGVVTLKGEVASPDLAARAQQLAENQEGVKEVDNELTVSRATTTD